MSFEWGFPNKIKFQKKKFQIEETSVEHKVEKNYIVIFIFWKIFKTNYAFSKWKWQNATFVLYDVNLH